MSKRLTKCECLMFGDPEDADKPRCTVRVKELEAELQAAQEREKALREKAESFCRLEPRPAVVRTWQRSFREALAAQRTDRKED